MDRTSKFQRVTSAIRVPALPKWDFREILLTYYSQPFALLYSDHSLRSSASVNPWQSCWAVIVLCLTRKSLWSSSWMMCVHFHQIQSFRGPPHLQGQSQSLRSPHRWLHTYSERAGLLKIQGLEVRDSSTMLDAFDWHPWWCRWHRTRSYSCKWGCDTLRMEIHPLPKLRHWWLVIR